MNSLSFQTRELRPPACFLFEDRNAKVPQERIQYGAAFRGRQRLCENARMSNQPQKLSDVGRSDGKIVFLAPDPFSGASMVSARRNQQRNQHVSAECRSSLIELIDPIPAVRQIDCRWAAEIDGLQSPFLLPGVALRDFSPQTSPQRDRLADGFPCLQGFLLRLKEDVLVQIQARLHIPYAGILILPCQTVCDFVDCFYAPPRIFSDRRGHGCRSSSA